MLQNASTKYLSLPLNVVMESGVHPFLQPNFYHRIIYAKFNLEIHYPQPYEREIWHYSKVEEILIRHVTRISNWETAFLNLLVNERVYIFKKTIQNTLSNFIPQETTTCDDKDHSWINEKNKKKY